MSLLLAAAVALVAAAPIESFQAEVMATRVSVSLPASPGARADALAVFDLFRDLESRVSEWREGSEVSAVNRAAGGAPVAVDPEVFALVELGVDVGLKTGCAFDASWAALWGAWDFRAAHPRLPDPGELAGRVALVDCREVELDRAARTVRLTRPGMKLGLGGIAKGWALDRAAELLAERGLHDFNLSAGGQVYVAGLNTSAPGGGRPWRVGIRDPRGAPDDWFAMIEASDLSVSTSGDYERYFVLDGVRYHHILDPRTGSPARGLRSVTVVAGSAALADALSTAIFVQGPERGLATAEAWPGVDALLVDDGGRVTMSSGLRGKVRVRHAPAP